MKTLLETKTNTTQWVEQIKVNPVEKTIETLNKSLLSTVERWEIVNKKWAERLAIQRETLQEIQPLTDNTHFMVERQLAEMFWLKDERVSKLKDDFKEPLTVSSVLADAEWFWDSHDIVRA